ncbi:hypothetical protein ACHAXR_001330 [Thalassiosira sp. AJA248-18]
MSRFAITISEPRLEATRSNNRKRRILRERKPHRAQIFDGRGGRKSNGFLDQFEDALTNDSKFTNATNFAALILKQDKIYCRKSQMKKLSRVRYFVQMLRRGLSQYSAQIEASFDAGFPILVKHDDSNGCYPATHRDKYGFPRLTWSIPANETRHLEQIQQKMDEPSSWCSAIGMPSYKTWKDLNHGDQRMPNIQSNSNDALYPWNAKKNKAVWRGSTTCNKGMYGHLPLREIPRSKLVKSSLERPDLIDAGFHKLVGKYEDRTFNKKNRVMLKDPIPLDDMMKYKAILDIDGNNWSARFSTLLCTNSVIIKIIPDFVEQYYHELEPNKHYIPASLDNLTKVVEYVLGEGNDVEMRGIVKNANKWCQRSRSKESLAAKAMLALNQYQYALEGYDGGHWVDEWEGRSTLEAINDLVECNV